AVNGLRSPHPTLHVPDSFGGAIREVELIDRCETRSHFPRSSLRAEEHRQICVADRWLAWCRRHSVIQSVHGEIVVRGIPILILEYQVIDMACCDRYGCEFDHVEISRWRGQRQDVGDPVSLKHGGTRMMRGGAVIGMQGHPDGPASSCGVPSVIRNQINTNLLEHSGMLCQET